MTSRNKVSREPLPWSGPRGGFSGSFHRGKCPSREHCISVRVFPCHPAKGHKPGLYLCLTIIKETGQNRTVGLRSDTRAAMLMDGTQPLSIDRCSINRPDQHSSS